MPTPSTRPPKYELRKTAALNAAGAAGALPSHWCSSPKRKLRQNHVAGSIPARDAAPVEPPTAPLPAPWDDYFDRRIPVACPDRGATFNVFTAGSSGPVVMCLHGGGMSGLSWALVAKLLAAECRVVAPDLRGHGVTEAEEEHDLSAATLAHDVAAIWAALFGSGEGRPPATVLVGHSMGGAIAVRAAALRAIPSLEGLVVVDVVEGTALASLPFMQSVLQRRPASFPSLQAAVEWAISSGTCRSAEAARASLPSMLVQRSTRSGGGGRRGAAGRLERKPTPAVPAVPLDPLVAGTQTEGSSGTRQLSTIAEEDAGRDAGSGAEAGAERHAQLPGLPLPGADPAAPAVPTGDEAGSHQSWVWRTRLEESAAFWEGWYKGLSDLFVSVPVPKVLILAGADRLDKPLTVGQMQGRFQLVLLPRAGHAVHEDEPERVAGTIATFLQRFRVGESSKEPAPVGGLPPVLPLAAGPPV